MAKIVIVGAGYAGMLAAKHLEHLGEPFTLINNHEYHYLTTLLHEVAGGRGAASNYAIPVKEVLRQPSSELVVDEVTGIDRDRKMVHGKCGEWSYDWLIMTLGWVSEYFGIPGLQENSLTITNLNSAAAIRKHIEDQFQLYVTDHDAKHLRIVIGGAGLTGIELLGELTEHIPKLCVQYGIDKSNVDVQCVEGMPTVLPQVAEPLRDIVLQTLSERGVTFRLNTKLMRADPGVVHVGENQTIEAGTIIWTGGVRANPLLAGAEFTCDRKGRAKVNAYLQSIEDDHIFIGGDCSWFEEQEGKPLPPTAQVAEQQGKFLGENVSAMIHGRAMKPFHASLKGTLASLGTEIGVGDMFGIKVKGLVAGLAKEGSKVKYLWELGGIRLAAEKSGQVLHI